MTKITDLKVNHPSHYNQGGIEVIDFMKAYSTHTGFCDHLRLTCIKYLARGPIKGAELTDYKKARWYLDKLIEELSE